MKSLINIKIILIFVILLAAFLRFNQLANNPPSLTWDEVAWGYNAYSLGLDGRDEFGKLLPISFIESFGDFKPPVYAYLGVIPVKVLGLSEFSTRFPSALFGALTVLITYFLVRRIFNKSEKRESYALLSCLFLAISPWHIMLSRGAFEANVATFFIVTGVWTFLVGVQDKKWFFIVSAVFFALSFYTFNTARIVSPLLILLLVAFFRKEVFMKKEAIIAGIIGLAILLPSVPFLLSPQASLRFKEVNIFSDGKIIETANQEIKNDQNALWSKIIHNRRVLFTREYLKHYFDNFNPSFLFIKGDGNPKFSTQNVGQMYIWDIIFVVAGVLFIFKRREGNWWLIPAWLLLGIIPAGFARETPHALRIESALPTFQILSAYGFVQLTGFLGKYKKPIIYFLLLLLFFNFTYFYKDQISNYPYDFSGEWQYGYKDSIKFAESVEKNYDEIRVTNVLGRPYIYYLFYGNISPVFFRDNVVIKRDTFGFVSVDRIGKYVFPKEFKSQESKTKRVLYINSPHNLPKDIKKLKTFYLLSGEPVLTAYTYD